MIKARMVRTVCSLAGPALVAASLAGIAGCGDAPASPSSYAPFSQSDLVVGTGTEAVAGNALTVHYTGWFYNADATDQKGAQFESSVGSDPFVFTLGAGEVITGWDQGVVGMKVGGVRRLVIPPSMAYGGVRSGILPPYSTLLFEVQLIAAE